MDLPTYTNIWRIEKRLYKLYDFRLPMPLPVGQIAVFLAIAVPYIGLLAILGLPFSHTLLWLYVLPPGVLAWLTTRPVLESKKLPELDALTMAYQAMEAGAAGVDMGRNIFQSDYPEAMIRAVRAVVHGSAKPEEAFEEFVRPQAQARAQARTQEQAT